MRRAFTLTELLIVIMIIGIMAGLALSALSGATELAREQRTRSIVNKLDQLISEQWEEYRTRAVPIRFPQTVSANPRLAAQCRLYALRDLQRMEMPERVTDVTDSPATIYTGVQLPQPSSWKRYRRLATAALGTNWANLWTQQNEGAECLYLMVSRMTDGDKSALDFFSATEIGDTDADGMKEILDAWGNPIHFLRWAPGYTIENGCLTTQSSAYTSVPTQGASGTVQIRNCSFPDIFDPMKVDPRWTLGASPYPACFALKPLIVSAGHDKILDLAMKGSDSSGGQFHFTNATPVDDPFYYPTVSGQFQFGTPQDFDGDGLNHADNITNHYQETP